MRVIVFYFVITLVVGCSKQTFQPLPEKRIDTFFVTKIDSTENNYIIDGLIGKDQKFVLISKKIEQQIYADCDKLVKGKKYTLNLEFEVFALGDFDGYEVDSHIFPPETAIANSPDLQGLCIIW